MWQNTPMIYARFNLINNEFYIGQTKNWRLRFEQHTREVCKHKRGLCKGCNAHHSYTRQAMLHPSSWVTMPLAFTILEDLQKLEGHHTETSAESEVPIWRICGFLSVTIKLISKNHPISLENQLYTTLGKGVKESITIF